MMIRTDGNYTIYIIEHKQDQGSNGRGWVTSSIDHFGTPPAGKFVPGKELPDRFDACGKCWQKTGITGVFSQTIAQKTADWLNKKYKDNKFRVTRLDIIQHRTAV